MVVGVTPAGVPLINTVRLETPCCGTLTCFCVFGVCACALWFGSAECAQVAV